MPEQAGASWGKFKLAQCSHCFLSPLCFVHYLCKWNKLRESLRCPTWTKRVRLTGRKLMAHHQNQNGFTWEKKKTDSLYHCPIQTCDHDGFKSQRGCRKHVNTKHSWFFFFDPSGEITKQTARVMPSFSVSSQIGDLLTKCLTGSGGGCKKDRAAQ